MAQVGIRGVPGALRQDGGGVGAHGAEAVVVHINSRRHRQEGHLGRDVAGVGHALGRPLHLGAEDLLGPGVVVGGELGDQILVAVFAPLGAHDATEADVAWQPLALNFSLKSLMSPVF